MTDITPNLNIAVAEEIPPSTVMQNPMNPNTAIVRLITWSSFHARGARATAAS